MNPPLSKEDVYFKFLKYIHNSDYNCLSISISKICHKNIGFLFQGHSIGMKCIKH